MRSGLAQSVVGGGVGELPHHGGHEAGGGAEEGLDVGAAEGQVGEGDDCVAVHLRAGLAARCSRGGEAEVPVNITLDLS